MVVVWHHFDDFDPDDDVIFGIVPAGTSFVRHHPAQGLPEATVQPIEVTGADWSSFVFTSYAAIGIVEARGRELETTANSVAMRSGDLIRDIDGGFFPEVLSKYATAS